MKTFSSFLVEGVEETSRILPDYPVFDVKKVDSIARSLPSYDKYDISVYGGWYYPPTKTYIEAEKPQSHKKTAGVYLPKFLNIRSSDKELFDGSHIEYDSKYACMFYLGFIRFFVSKQGSYLGSQPSFCLEGFKGPLKKGTFALCEKFFDSNMLLWIDEVRPNYGSGSLSGFPMYDKVSNPLKWNSTTDKPTHFEQPIYQHTFSDGRTKTHINITAYNERTIGPLSFKKDLDDIMRL